MTKLVVGPIPKGLKTNVLPFNIDDDSFPYLFNAYQWRARVKRKRGNVRLGRLQRYLGTTNGSGNLTVTIAPGNITSGVTTIVIGTEIFVDGGGANPVTLTTNSLGATHTLNRTSGVLTITGSTPSTAVMMIPTLPVMGLEDLLLDATQYPSSLFFDTRYSYGVLNTFPFTIYDVSFYKNPSTTGMPGSYVPKGTWTPVAWNANDYQQVWSTNYTKAFWATYGIDIPFTGANVGMQYKPITTVTVSGPTTATLAIANHGLVIGDFVFVNEVVTTTGINWQTGYVTATVVNVSVDVTFPFANIATNGTGGIAQYLTSTATSTLDCIRWYDGDPTSGTGANPPTFAQGKGWVNFMPPLSQSEFSIGGLAPAIWYLVGARMILPFKDRILFIGPVVQTSAAGSQVYLQDTIIYSQNGTPYYTASFDGEPTSAATEFHPLLVPQDQTASAAAYFSDSTGFGGFVRAGIDQPIVTASPNEDVIMLGFNNSYQVRLVYTGNDVIPFEFYTVNSELGASSTFSVVNFDDGVMTSGSRGYVKSNQSKAERFDDDILDQSFQIRLEDNGAERVTAIRDFINEWVYFTYPDNEKFYKFNNQTLLFNYREGSWAIFDECYTTYGSFRKRTGYTWDKIGTIYSSWEAWNDPWNAGESTLYQPDVISGNQQGYVFFRDEGTSEPPCLAIQNIANNVVTSPNHTLNEGDYITFTDILGTVGTALNNKIFSVMATVDDNSFALNPYVDMTGLTYLGGGQITRMYVPYIQTKQFPTHWGIGRKTRIGNQQYLLTTTQNSQITLLIFLSQNADDPYNDGPIIPEPGSVNDSLIYSTILYTCPESTNLGLTPANINLQMVTAQQQSQIWHRVNTSLLGDTIQLGFTMSDAQMRELDDEGNFTNQFAEIELHGFMMEVSPSMLLA